MSDEPVIDNTLPQEPEQPVDPPVEETDEQRAQREALEKYMEENPNFALPVVRYVEMTNEPAPPPPPGWSAPEPEEDTQH